MTVSRSCMDSHYLFELSLSLILWLAIPSLNRFIVGKFDRTDDLDNTRSFSVVLFSYGRSLAMERYFSKLVTRCHWKIQDLDKECGRQPNRKFLHLPLRYIIHVI